MVEGRVTSICASGEFKQCGESCQERAEGNRVLSFIQLRRKFSRYGRSKEFKRVLKIPSVNTYRMKDIYSGRAQ